ncbi:MAG: DinB family protein [Pirellulaceae bacterium]
MRTIDILAQSLQFNRVRTLGLLAAIEQDARPQEVLAWRPGPKRAHIAWQLMHIGITEELFATERLMPDKVGEFQELWPRFRGGSTPDDLIPSAHEIRTVLNQTREHLLDTLSRYSDEQLTVVPAAFKERGLTFRDVLHLIAFHEAHHQGQAHITLNLYRNR